MSWILLGVIVASAVGAILVLWRKWVAPWKQVEQLVKRIGNSEQPPTFLVGGPQSARRVGLALENLFKRQAKLDRQLAQQDSGTATVFTAMQDGLLVVGVDRRVTLLNQAGQRLFGLSSHAIGGPLSETLRNPTIDQMITEAVTSGAAVQREVSIADRKLEMNAVPMRNGETIAGAVVLFHDITELRRADQIRRDFVANVSHELRTPLSILRGYIETLIDDPNMPRSEVVRILDVMERHSKRLGLLADDLLSLARLESANSNLQWSDVNVAGLFDGVARDWAKRFAAKKLKATIELPRDLTMIRADEARLREVIDNLLDNAVKYSGEKGEIYLRGERRDGEAILSVRDNGAGISKEDLPRIFERFYRADKARSRELAGTGLGLSIVKHIAQLHGGRVEAESGAGRGTTVRVILPIVTET